ncbi:MAG: nitrogen regulation protein NR(II) [Gammaproteobacteria bacterium]|nr:nitrogen regulation protein NR(II) [Gammaproteobacteria bacterium]
MNLDNVYKRLLDQLKTGVLLLDENLRPSYLNLAAEALFEISGKQAPKMVLGDVLLDAQEDIDEIRQALINQTSFTKHEATFRLPTGKSITVDYTINFIEESGHPQILMEVNSLYYSQRISKDEAILSTQATTRELVRGLAHEIKNPLGGIRGAAQLLADELPNEELTDYTNVIIEEADRLRNLVDRLVGAKKLPVMKLVNIHEVLERVTSLIEAEENNKTIELVKDYDPSIPSFMGDPEQLIQAILNIVRNAVQAMDSPAVDHDLGKILLRTRIARQVTIGNTLHRLVVRVEIEDNGPGIPAQITDTLFYPMISGRAEGSGLGLSIAQSIINQHGGIIECNSEPGSTIFSITIPLSDGNQD